MSTAGGVAASVAAIAARKRQDLFERFRQRGAVSESTALTLDELELGKNPVFRMQLREGTVIPTAAGRYYLDQEVVARREYHRRILVTGLVGILILALLIFWIVARL